MKPRKFHSLEILEDRIAPAGIVTAVYLPATGELTLEGDDVDNSARVFQTGVNAYRIAGDATLIATTGNPAGAGFLDIGKLTKLTILGGDGNDTFSLTNLRTLSTLSFSGGLGDDLLAADNLTVKTGVNLTTGDGADRIVFDGVSTLIGGDLTLTESTGGVELHLNSANTVIGGKIDFIGGDGLDLLTSTGGVGRHNEGPLSIGRGLRFVAGAGGGILDIDNSNLVSIGKLVTGESILFEGGADDDSLSLGAQNATLTGGVRMTGLGGNDAIDFQNANGLLRVGKLATGQSVLFDGGAGNDSIGASAVSLSFTGGIEFIGGDGSNGIALAGANGTARIGGSIKFIGGADDDTLNVESSNFTLSSGIDFTGGDGLNSVSLGGPNGSAHLGKLTTGQSIKFTGGASVDLLGLSFASFSSTGSIELMGGAGANAINLQAPGGKVSIGKGVGGASIKLIGGVDTDSIDSTVSLLCLGGGIDFAGSEGDNHIALDGPNGAVKVGVLATGQSLKYTGGAGSDEFSSEAANVALAGGIEFAGGDGGNGIHIDNAGSVRIGKFLTGQSVLFTGGAGIDEVFFGGNIVALSGSVEMTGGAGSDTIDADGGHVSIGKSVAGLSVLLVGGDDNDKIDLEETVALAGALRFDGGAGDDTLDLTQLSTLTVSGAVEFIGGADNDVLAIDAFHLSLGSTLAFTPGIGQGGGDVASIVADGAIAGDVSLNLGPSDLLGQSATLKSRTGLPSGLVLKGKLTVTASSGLGASDDLTITNVAVARAINLTLGAGASTVTIDNLVASDTFFLDAGDGDDVVNIERNSFVGNSIIKKLATLQLGNGSDKLLIGVAPNTLLGDHNRVQFLGGLAASGGAPAAPAADTDQRNDIAAENLIAGAPAIVDFDVVLLP